MDKIETPEQYMLDLNWDRETLEECKKRLIDLDKRDEKYYSKVSKMSATFDKAEREHFRNCIEFWEKRLNNET